MPDAAHSSPAGWHWPAPWPRCSPILPSRSEGAERIVDSDAPVCAGDERPGLSGTLRQAGLMQAECKLDDVGNAFAGQTFALLIPERFGVAARRQEALLEMLGTDNAEMLGRDRLAVLAHRGQEFSDAIAVDPIDAEELRQRLVRAAHLCEDLALHGSP